MSSKLILPCSKSRSIAQWAPTEACDHLRCCIHCSLHYLIYTRKQYNKKNYVQQISEDPLAIYNMLLHRKLINNQQYFNLHFQSVGQGVLMEVNTFIQKKISSDKSVIFLLQWLFVRIKSRNIKFLFMSNANVKLLKSMYNMMYKLLKLVKLPDIAVFNSFAAQMAFISRRIQMHEKSLRSTIAYLNPKIQSLSLSLLDMSIKFDFFPVTNEIKRQLELCLMVDLNHCKCGNVSCGNIYLQHKYAIICPYEFEKDINVTAVECITLYKMWKKRKAINKWYICSGCKCVKYCSRHCQKISWNKQNHAVYCKKKHNGSETFFGAFNL
eukprot:433335_1